MWRYLLILLLAAAALLGQPVIGGARDPRWQTVGAGALASRPAACVVNRHVYICNGAGCTTNGAYHYCTSTNTWTVASGAIGGPPTGASGGDLTGTYPNPSVAGIGGTALPGLGTGLLKLTAGVPSLGVAGTDFVGGQANLPTVSVIPRVSAAGVLGPSYCSVTYSPLVFTCYDPTGVTGATTLVVRAGAGQGATKLQTWRTAADVEVATISPTGVFASVAGYSIGTTSYYSALMAGLNNSGFVAWSPTAVYAVSSTADSALSRTSAGRVQMNSGTTGQWGGLDTGSVSMKSLATPGAVTVTPTCTADCTQTWTYTVAALLTDGTLTTVPGAAGSTAVQNAALNATNYNTLSCTAVTGATNYRFRRTVSGGTPATLGVIGTASICALVDNGLVGDGSAAPTVNTTGSLLWATDGGGNIGKDGANRPNAVYTGSVYATSLYVSAFTYVGGQAIFGGGATGSNIAGGTTSGYLTLRNHDSTNFSCLQFGGTTNAFGALCRDGAGLKVRVASNDAYAPLDALSYKVSGVAGVDKVCVGAPTAMTVSKGIITAITCPE